MQHCLCHTSQLKKKIFDCSVQVSTTTNQLPNSKVESYSKPRGKIKLRSIDVK